MRKLLCLTAVIALFSLAPAQVTSTEKGLKDIDFLLGEWSGTIKMTLPGSTEALDVPTTVSVKEYGPFQETVYVLNMPGMGPFTGHMFTTWDESAKVYKSWTFDSNANEPRTEKGTFDGKKFVMTSDPHGGTVTRVTFEKKSAKEVGFLLEMKEGDAFNVLATGVYTKK